MPNNRLWGTIPTEMGNLKKFHTLVASNNLLESPFPDKILENNLMGTIFIERNKFTGPLPERMATQSNLLL